MSSRPRPTTATALCAILFTLLFAFAAAAEPVDIVFGPAGGFAPSNRDRTIAFKDGSTEPVLLNNVVRDWIERTPDAGAIRIAMYNFDFEPVWKALVDAARRGVEVRVLLDNCAEWTEPNVKSLIERVALDEATAKKDGKPFDFRMRIVTKEKMAEHGRTRKLDDGKVIYGTFHQKFGVFHEDRARPPLHAFGGSSNICRSSEQQYAENRVFFRDEAKVAAAYLEVFARLWNDYAEPATRKAPKEPAPEGKGEPPYEILFNALKTGPGKDAPHVRIDKRIEELVDEVRPDGSLDLMMFSFTHFRLANKILDAAKKNPGAKFRLLFDHSMLEETPDKKSLMPPYLETKAVELGLANVEIRYKFRANAYGWMKETEKVEMDHFRSKLLHHKVMIVNKEKIIFGSYNWSGSAEERNFEDAFVFTTATPAGTTIITRFLAEFDFLWDRFYGAWDGTGERPYTISGPEGRAWAKRIVKLLSEDEEVSKTRYPMERGDAMTLEALAEFRQKGTAEVEGWLKSLMDEKLVHKVVKDGQEVYELGD